MGSSIKVEGLLVNNEIQNALVYYIGNVIKFKMELWYTTKLKGLIIK